MRKKTQSNIIIVLLVILIILIGYNLYIATQSTIKQIGDINKISIEKPGINEFEFAAKKATPAVVSISAGEKSGSGAIVREDGIIATNYHVIKDENKVSVALPDKRIFSAGVIGSDPQADIAVLKIDAENLPKIEFANSDTIEIGEKVLAIGQPFGFDSTVTTGIISGKHRDRGPTEYRDFLQTDASINPGNSGGPLINLEGKLVGINTFIVSGVRTGELGFAIPSNLVSKILDQLLKYGKVTRGYLGINVKDIVDIDENGTGKILSGALITAIQENGSADRAGLKVNDFIIEINNIKIENTNHLRNIVAWLEPGGKVKIVVERDKKELEFEVIIGTRPENP